MIRDAFTQGPAFIGYLTLGDGGLDYSLEAALALIQGGVDLLEIGIPFSDPVADGPVIQQAMHRSLTAGTQVTDLIPFLTKLRAHTQIPLVIFSYYNPLFALGKSFITDAKRAGADGILIVDLPFEENHFGEILDPILIATSTTSDERLKEISARGRGFIYYVCQKGTTGMRDTLPPHVPEEIRRIKRFTELPIACGFGISKREMARDALLTADAFVVGSYFVSAMGRKVTPQELTHLAQAIDPRRKS
jgi:tryptophan synthase alpha chain